MNITNPSDLALIHGLLRQFLNHIGKKDYRYNTTCRLLNTARRELDNNKPSQS